MRCTGGFGPYQKQLINIILDTVGNFSPLNTFHAHCSAPKEVDTAIKKEPTCAYAFTNGISFCTSSGSRAMRGAEFFDEMMRSTAKVTKFPKMKPKDQVVTGTPQRHTPTSPPC